ncbi:MAG: BamA/TamA family outer membrane protein [Acidobacteria bacterium]|nr:BamA/TamA family outer membrane protein [Acidobacteriota bacterium]
MARKRSLAVLAVALLTAAWVTASEPTVRSVSIISDSPLDQARIERVLGLTEGQPLDRRQIREGLRALFAGGDIESARVETSKATGGIAVTVRLRVRPRVDSMVVRGPGLLWRRRIRDWLQVQAGAWFSAGALDSGVRRVIRELHERAYTSASVQPWVEYSDRANAVSITIDVDLGEPLRLTAVRLSGVADPDGKLSGAAGALIGDKLTSSVENRVRRRIDRAMREAGYWEADVLQLSREPAEGGASLLIRVSPGPSWEMQVSAPPADEKLAHEVVPDPTQGEIHPAQTAALREQIRQALQERGYLLARASVEMQSTKSTRSLRITIDPDGHRKITEVAFPGAAAIPLKKLRRTVSVRTGKVGGWRHQAVTQASLDADRQALITLYQERGYADVRVERAVLQPVGEDGVRVLFPITEGTHWVVEDLRLEGFPAEVAVAAEARPLPLTAGGPWDPNRVKTTRRQLDTALADAGYPEGQVTADVDTSQAGRARIVLRAAPGQFVSISRIVIAGLHDTNESVVRRIVERAGLRPGAPYSLQAILTAQRKLYELGIFRRVEILPVPGQERRARRGIVVRCDEGLQHSYLVGVGWDTVNGPHATLGWSDLNVLGGAHAFSFETRLSGRETRVQAGLREAYLPGIGLPGYAALYRTEEKFSAYSQKRRGLWFEIGDRRLKPFRPWLRYEYQIVEPNAPPEILSELERQDQKIQEASLMPTVEWDTRNDPFLPTQGALASVSLKYAFPLLKANSRFLKAEGRFSIYGRLPGGTGAVGLRLGATRPVATGGDQPGNLKVPINERFFAGGGFSHRAFPTDRLGIPGQTLDAQGDAIGGNALVLLNVEYRRTIRGALSAVLFVDSGNVWAEPNRVRFSDLRWGAGFGLRYDTPAGPLRLEYGLKLDRKPGESRGELFVAFGSPF